MPVLKETIDRVRAPHWQRKWPAISRLTLPGPPSKISVLVQRPRQACRIFYARLLPPRSTAGQLTLDQHIGVRIPGGQPISSITYYEAQPHGLAARHQTVMGIGQGECRKEADRHATDLTFTAAVADPVVTVIVRLFRSPAEALDGARPT